MNIINVTDEKYKDVWDSFLIASGRSSYLQSWQWGSVMQKSGKEVFRIATVDNDENGNARLRAIMTVWIKKISLGKEIIVIPQGPILDFMNQDAYSIIVAMFDRLEEIAKERKTIFLRVSAPILSSEVTYLGSYFASLKGNVKATKKHLIGEKFYKLNIKSDQNVVSEKFNFNLKNAQDRFEIASTNDHGEIKFLLNSIGGKGNKDQNNFWPLVAENMNQTPAVIPLQQKETKIILPLKLFYATRKGTCVAGVIVIYFGSSARVVYEITQTTKDVAALYLIHHRAIQDARENNLSQYVVENDKSIIATQFGGAEETMSDTCDVIYKKFWYKLLG